jgi:hypothetical protein
MAEGERATEPSRDVPPMADRDVGSSPSAPVVELREPKSPTPSGMRKRIAVVIGLLMAATLLYIGLFALLHRHQPAVESVFGVTGSEPPLDLTLNVLSVDPVREVINVRVEVVEPSESRLWRTLNPADVRGFVVRVDDRYLTFQVMAEASGANPFWRSHSRVRSADIRSIITPDACRSAPQKKKTAPRSLFG